MGEYKLKPFTTADLEAAVDDFRHARTSLEAWRKDVENKQIALEKAVEGEAGAKKSYAAADAKVRKIAAELSGVSK